ncbi:hypothetical protein B0H14DRAFT_2652235 [Mycena olivaceomarginata]|nr:hypothetical protein B0H14DRAFT_2652235 [Mycena olivaceomarginata]
MQCKGVLILGEIVEGDGEVFLSMINVFQGSACTWTPVCSKGILQAFVDFLVTCKKEEKGWCRVGLLGMDLRTQYHGSRATGSKSNGCWSAKKKAKEGEKDKRKAKKAKKRTGTEESEEEEEEDVGWDGSDTVCDDDPLADEEEEVDQLQSSTDNEHCKLPFHAKPSLRYQQIAAKRLHPSTVSSAMNESTDDENNGAPLPTRPQPKPTYCHAAGDPQPAAGMAMDVDSAPADKEPSTCKTPPANKDAALDHTPPANKDATLDHAPLAPADKDVAADDMPPMDVDNPAADNDTTDRPPALHSSSPSALRAACPVKYKAVLELFDTVVEGGIWELAVDASLTLEQVSGFQIAGKVLSAKGRPGAVSWWAWKAKTHKDFYDAVILWWLSVNPAWRKDGITMVEDFETHGLNQQRGADLAGIPSGLNGLTSVLASLGWWYHIADVVEGSLRWRKLMDNVIWVLTEKHRALAHK